MESDALDKLTLVRKRAMSLGFAFVALFIFLSLITFSSGDLGRAVWPPSAGFANVCGQTGALLADWMMTTFGYAAYVAVALAIGFAVRCLMKRDLVDAWMSICGALIMLVSAAAALQLIGSQPAHIPGSGGVVGIAVSDILAHHVGVTGTWLVTVLLFSIGALLLSIDELVEWSVKHGTATLKGWLAARSERAAVTSRPRPVTEPAEPPIISRQTRPREPAPAPAPVVATTTEPDPEAPPETRLPPPASPEVQAKDRPIDRIAVVPSQVVDKDYQLPPLSLLEEPKPFDDHALESEIRDTSTTLERTLSEFGIGARVVGIEKGPQVTRYEIALAPGIKVNRITTLSDNIAMAVKAQSVRIVAPIPGRSTAGIEVPNAIKETVQLCELMSCDEFQSKKRKMILPVLLGKGASGAPILTDLARMPHLLIAGATNSGKSVCMNSIIVTVMMLHRPEDVRLILVDPKMVELGMFEGIPHLLTPVVSDMKRAPHVLEWATKQMDQRYDMLARVGVRHITQYNELGEDGIQERVGDDYDEDELPAHMPYIVIVVDELADMMMVAAKEVQVSITRLAQKSRAVGIHIILATQRPSVDVITGLIKSNLPTRISFKVTSKVDSRTILDRNGADKLLGAGDMLFIPPGTAELLRVQGTYASDQEIKKVVQFVKAQGEPAYMMNVKQLGRRGGGDSDGSEKAPGGEYSRDDFFEDACRVVLATGRGSVSLLQRKLEIGYTRAARLIEMMEAAGVVGSHKGSKVREVTMSVDEWEEKYGASAGLPAAPAVSQDEGTRFSDDMADDQAADES